MTKQYTHGASPALAAELVRQMPAPATETPARPHQRQRIALALHVDEHRCLSCAGCISVCPRMAVPISGLNSLAEGTLCQGCGLCVQVCPVEALSQVPVFISEPLRVPGGRDQRQAARVALPVPPETQ